MGALMGSDDEVPTGNREVDLVADALGVRRPCSVKGSLLVAGTTSDAGKSVVTTGLCRLSARSGVRVAPCMAQNMSNNSMVVGGPDGQGAEIGRAQWIQAVAAGATPKVAMNPVLLKPGSDLRSHVSSTGYPLAPSPRPSSQGRGDRWLRLPSRHTTQEHDV
jgi:hypothetical protein